MKAMLKTEMRTFSSNKPLVEQRRHEIARSAVKIFAKKGYERTGMRDIATACGITTGTLYYYVGSKKDILWLVLEMSQFSRNERFEFIQSQLDDVNVTEALQQAIKMYLEHVDEQQDTYIFLVHAPLALNREDRRVLFESSTANPAFFRKFLKQGIGAGEFRNIDPDFVASIIVRTANAWALSRWTLRKRYTLETYTNKLIEFVVDSVCKR